MHAPDSASIGAVRAVVDDPVVTDPGGWQVGAAPTPSPPDPAVARAARLEARLAVYAQYATVLAEEAAAAVAGDEARRAVLSDVRGAAAEHFAELREAATIAAETDTAQSAIFADALTDALHELRHQDAVDRALARRLRALHDTTAVRHAPPALAAGGPPARRLDLRF